MIPDVDALVAGYPFVARRHGRVEHCNRDAVRRARDLAVGLSAGNEADVPAALFCAFARVRAAFPFAWKLMARRLAQEHARRLGLAIRATNDELDALCLEVLHQHMDWPAIRAWFLARCAPSAPD